MSTKKEFRQLVDKIADKLSTMKPFAGKVEPRQVSTTCVEMKVHKVRLLHKDPFCASVPSEMLMECDTWILKPFQERCKRGHKIEYVES